MCLNHCLELEKNRMNCICIQYGAVVVDLCVTLLLSVLIVIDSDCNSNLIGRRLNVQRGSKIITQLLFFEYYDLLQYYVMKYSIWG